MLIEKPVCLANLPVQLAIGFLLNLAFYLQLFLQRMVQMKTRRRLIALSSIAFCMPLLAEIHIEPDPERPGGYIVSKADLEAREAELTPNPMYAVWALSLIHI